MKAWSINTFYGGIALDDSLGRSNQFGQNSRHLDIYSEPGSIRPQWGLHDDIDGDMGANAAISDFCIASDGNIYAFGEKSDGSGQPALYYKIDVHSSWTEVAVGTQNAIPSRLYEYKDYLYFWEKTDYIGRYGPLLG